MGRDVCATFVGKSYRSRRQKPLAAKIGIDNVKREILSLYAFAKAWWPRSECDGSHDEVVGGLAVKASG